MKSDSHEFCSLEMTNYFQCHRTFGIKNLHCKFVSFDFNIRYLGYHVKRFFLIKCIVNGQYPTIGGERKVSGVAKHKIGNIFPVNAMNE